MPEASTPRRPGEGARRASRHAAFDIVAAFLRVATCVFFAGSAVADKTPVGGTGGGGAFLGGEIGTAACESIRVGDAAATRDGEGRFFLRLDLARPEYVTLECGGRLRLFLSPGDSLWIAWRWGEADVVPRFSGRGAEVNRFLAEVALLEPGESAALMGSYFRLAAGDETTFVAAFDSLWTVVGAPLERFLATGAANTTFARTERARIAYARAEGFLRYPLVHRQIVDDASFEVSEGYQGALDSLALDDAELLALEEFQSFLHAYVDDRADSALRADPALQRGDARRTRARYAVATRRLADRAVRDHVLSWILEDHIGDLGVKGIDSLLAAFRAECADSGQVRAVEALFEKEARYREGHAVEIYKSVDGVDLEAHVFVPEGHVASDRRPAFVWFHGAGWIRGAWYWCLGLCEHFRSRGMVMIQIEYRLSARHGSTPLESIADAKSAIRWVRANAARLGVDPERIVASGFSAGGHLAMAAASLDRFDEPTDDRAVSCVPDALVLYGACLDPTGDPWYRKVVRPLAPLEDASPAHHVRPGLPPTALVHGTLDKSCSFAAAERFVEEMTGAGNRCEIHSFPGRGHFFLVERKADRDEALRLTDAFLESIGVVGGGGGSPTR